MDTIIANDTYILSAIIQISKVKKANITLNAGFIFLSFDLYA